MDDEASSKNTPTKGAELTARSLLPIERRHAHVSSSVPEPPDAGTDCDDWGAGIDDEFADVPDEKADPVLDEYRGPDVPATIVPARVGRSNHQRFYLGRKGHHPWAMPALWVGLYDRPVGDRISGLDLLLV
jgi:hypothetical protein